MDIWNNEILSYSLSKKRGDRMTYMSGLKEILDIKAQYPEMEMVLHTDYTEENTMPKFLLNARR
jgi:hypothetical protein